MGVVEMKSLLEAGVHFGHQTRRWNPKMKKYIFIKRNGIHIIDLKQTLEAINQSYYFIRELALKGKKILFVGTKKQVSEGIQNAAEKCDEFFVSHRWYGGTLTNLIFDEELFVFWKSELYIADPEVRFIGKLDRMKRINLFIR